MHNLIPLASSVDGRMISTRVSAHPLREQAEELLRQGCEVIFSFEGIQVTQSFIDELIGVLILQQGPEVLNKVIFKNCSDDVEAIIKFVAADRCDQYIKAHSH